MRTFGRPRRRTVWLAVGAALATIGLGTPPALSAVKTKTVTPQAALPGAAACPMLPADNVWHADVSQLPVDPKSSTYVATEGSGSSLHPDFGAGMWDGGPIGIPYNVVPGTQPKVAVSFDYADESDPGPYPIPPNPLIEGGPSSTGDRHILIVDKDACLLYELYDAHPLADGTWHAGSGAIWSLTSDALRPSGWTSADAAGLPILPGLVRYDEVASGTIDHAIRMTVPYTDARFIWPARHQAGSSSTSRPPMGLRMRLKAGVDISHYSAANQVILRALQTYGALIADNGSAWFISGAPDSRWSDDDLHNLGQLHGSDFEAVDESSLMADPNSGAVKATGTQTATTTSLAAAPNPVAAGQTVTLTATVTPTAATGTVTFTDGTATLGSAAVSGGTARISTSSLAAGTHSVKAAYGGDATYAASTSPAVGVTVTAPAQSIRVTSPNGGESWSRTKGHAITWTSTGFAGSTSVRIDLLKGGSVVTTIKTTTIGTGSYTWTPSRLLSKGSNYQVRITVPSTSPTVADTSDGTFSIT